MVGLKYLKMNLSGWKIMNLSMKFMTKKKVGLKFLKKNLKKYLSSKLKKTQKN